jgi:hypothetical protein
MSRGKHWRIGRAVLLGSVVLVALVAFLINRRVEKALETASTGEQAVEFVAVPERSPLPFWGGEDIESVVALPGGLYAAGASGVARLEPTLDPSLGAFERIDISRDLPTRRAVALSAWRTDLAVALSLEGLFVYREGSWLQVRSGFGALHVRALAESVSGELWIGAREGLFRIGFAERTVARLHQHSVRSVVVGDGGRVFSGGETGLFATEGGVTRAMRTLGLGTAWVDTVTVFDGRVHASTPQGVFAEGKDGVLRAVPAGANMSSISVLGDRLFGVAEPAESSVRRFDASGQVRIERVPWAARRLFMVGDRLLADTAVGLVERSGDSWRVISKRRQQESFGNAHIGALAAYRGRVVVGFFDGGLAELVPGPRRDETRFRAGDDAPMMLRTLPDPDPAAAGWAVNGLLDAGGALHIASLRGAFRLDGARMTPVEGTGASFSIAQTPGGVAIGLGEGVLLPERKLLSAFHGLPGNQATALASVGPGLLVGTPSGLGYIEERRVRWRVVSGEGRLPHPWVTAILPEDGGVVVGTYGGGLTRRLGAMSAPGEWRPFVETQGLKVNTGSLVRANGRIYAGTDGTGLFRLSRDGTRFERLKLPLPSERITALLEKDGFLYIGTDEGLTRWPVERDVPP